jgi:hypothetical protein
MGCSTQPASAADADQWRWADIQRVVVIPDIHGAYPEFVRLLQATDIVDDSLTWSGGSAHLVSLGDLLDRGADSRKVMDLLMRLQSESQEDGGFVHVVAGNHELMNLIGDLRYVSNEEYGAFAADEPDAMRNAEFAKYLRKLESADTTQEIVRAAFDKQYPVGFFAHRNAFATGGQYADWLTSLPAFLVINDTAFVHGGLPSIVATTEPGELNKEFKATISRYLQLRHELVEEGVLPDEQNKKGGDLASTVGANAESGNCLQERSEACEEQRKDSAMTANSDSARKLDEFIRLSEAPVLSTDGPLWYRGASMCRSLFARPILDASLANLGANNVVAGHTIPSDFRVHTLHDNKLTVLDTGMLVWYYKGRPAALIIDGDERIVQYLNPDERLAPVANNMPVAYGLSRIELLEALQQGLITEVVKTKGGAIIQLLHNDQQVRAVFSPRNRKGLGERELAAYKLDQLLGFDIVPLTVERSVEGKSGALRLSYPDEISETDRLQKDMGFGGWCSMSDQFELMYIWDTLIANAGRTTDNVLYQRQLWRLQLVDYSQAFTSNKRLPRPISSGKVPLTIKPEVQQALSQLTEATLSAELDGLLDKRSISALVARRDELLELVKD